MLHTMFRSVIDQDRAAVVLCNLAHEIVYMVALRDAKKELIGYYEKHEYRNAESAKTYDFAKSLI